jgi:uncharacterized protein YunC (DUF1805 family)
MIDVKPIPIDGKVALGIHVTLPKTNLLAITTHHGYIMCGALDVRLLNEQLADRGIIAARACGVRTLEELLNGTIESSTHRAQEIGIVPGIPCEEAVRILLRLDDGPFSS